MNRPRGYVPATPDEIEAVWADARRVVRAERNVMRRRALGDIKCHRCGQGFAEWWRFARHSVICRLESK